MAITHAQVQIAQNQQHAAAHDAAKCVRLVAGPGTGKSSTIEERVRWLISFGISPINIFVVSFTRAATRELKDRIIRYCLSQGVANSERVSVTTLHSLALRTLRNAGLLSRYPVDPLVMDQWELDAIFDAELANKFGHTKSRCQKIRYAHEAQWQTGVWNPANYISPTPPISQKERTDFEAYHQARTSCYSCVLPGEVVRACVDHIRAGTLNPCQLLQIQYLIVDEYQDLNPCDIEFIDNIAFNGANVFVVGDDDQSIYSFRFASPSGIQGFVSRHINAGNHNLQFCFRCTSNVLQTAVNLINANPSPNRIPKNISSLYSNSTPPVSGTVKGWIFRTGIAESKAVASSCQALINAGVSAKDIIILLSNTKALMPSITSEMDNLSVPYTANKTKGFITTNAGKFVLSLVRIVCNHDDYVALRVMLGLQNRVGIATCQSITEAVISNNLNYKNLFYAPLPTGVFSKRENSAIGGLANICMTISQWTGTDTLHLRMQNIQNYVLSMFGQQAFQDFVLLVNSLPVGITIEEFRDFLWCDSDEQEADLLSVVYERLNLPVPTSGFIPDKVRIMTMHGSKGLSARVVFIPGLEQEIFPSSNRTPYTGLVLEAARLLYTSITRARAACILSYASGRMTFGTFKTHSPSQFCHQLGVRFVASTTGLNNADVGVIMNDCNNL